MLIKDAIDLKERAFISLIGAGGKSTLFSLLARELYQENKKLVLTTTTHMFSSQLILPYKEAALIENNDEKVIEKKINYVFKERRIFELILVQHRKKDDFGEKVSGPSPFFLNKFWNLQYADYFLIEADGARGRPIKAPAAHEPVVCESTTDVIGVIGIDALGLSLSEKNVLRPKLFSQLTGLKMGKRITLREIATLICHPYGLLKNIPPNARMHLFINKVDDDSKKQSAKQLADYVLKLNPKKINDILICSGYNKEEPVAEVIKRSQ